MPLRTLLLLSLLAPAVCSAQRSVKTAPARAEAIFRHVSLGRLGQIELGKPFGDAARLSVSEGPNTYRLRDRTFGGAGAIVVTTDDVGIVRRVSFEYGPAYAWGEKLADYTQSLGTPTRATAAEAVWNDGKTEFRLTRDGSASYAARAEMRDLAPRR